VVVAVMEKVIPDLATTSQFAVVFAKKLNFRPSARRRS
jgi:hypothetical protein